MEEEVVYRSSILATLPSPNHVPASHGLPNRMREKDLRKFKNFRGVLPFSNVESRAVRKSVQIQLLSTCGSPGQTDTSSLKSFRT